MATANPDLLPHPPFYSDLSKKFSTFAIWRIRHFCVSILRGKHTECPVADPGGGGGAVKISHKKDGHQRQPYRFHVSRPRPNPAAGSATGVSVKIKCQTSD